MDEITKLIFNQKKAFDFKFDNCYISQASGERVAQTVTSIMDSTLREEIPVSKYIQGTVTICDGYVSQTITFHATDFHILSN